MNKDIISFYNENSYLFRFSLTIWRTMRRDIWIIREIIRFATKLKLDYKNKDRKEENKKYKTFIRVDFDIMYWNKW